MMSNKFKKAIEQRIPEEEFIEKEITNETQDVDIDYSVIDMIEIKDNKKAKNKTYYLEESVIKAVVQISKKKKMSESKVVNNILKHILNIT